MLGVCDLDVHHVLILHIPNQLNWNSESMKYHVFRVLLIDPEIPQIAILLC